jgi:diacylglycerol kinase family enzyme
VTVLGDLTLREVFCKFPKLYTGNLKGTKMHTITGSRIWASSRQKVLIDVDGECPGTLPVLIEMVPGAVNMVADIP